MIAQKILLMAKYSPRLIHRLGDGAQDLSDDGLLEHASAGAVRKARQVPSKRRRLIPHILQQAGVGLLFQVHRNR